MKDFNIFLIHKDGDINQMANYRGISLLNTTFKIATNILNKRKTAIKERSEIFDEGQGGCRVKRSCVYKGQIINNCIAEARLLNKQLIILSFDVSKAIGYGKKYQRVWNNIYSGLKGRVTMGPFQSEPFDYNSGIAQGDGGSPSLYCDFMELLHS